MSIVGLITDFGTMDHYVPSMKGAILSINQDAKIIDLTHDISKHDIRKASFVLANSVTTFPKDSTFVAVINPDAGKKRKCIFLRTMNGLNFVGPDNGVFSLVAEKFGIEEVREILNRDLMRSKVTNMFQGRDIMAPVAGYVSKGVDFSKVGPEMDGIKKLDFGEPEIGQERIKSRILNIDDFGNIVTNIKAEVFKNLVDIGTEVEIEIGGAKFEAPFVKIFEDVEKGEKLCYAGSEGFIELAKNQESLADELNTRGKEKLNVWI